MAIWMDLTNSLTQHKGNVVGIVRAELMLAKHLHEIDSSIRFSVLTRYGFREVKKSELKWLFKSKNINDDYKKYQKYKRNKLVKLCNKISKKLAWEVFRFKRHYIKPRDILGNKYITYPYKNGDVVYSCGWFGTKKEEFYTLIKNQLNDFKLVYTIYDFVLLKDNLKYLYAPGNLLFEDYIKWISDNCDSVVYGGNTAQKDGEKYFKENKLNVPKSYFIKWGDNIKGQQFNEDSEEILNKIGVKKPFILAVGSFDNKKNYKVLYNAYCLLKQHGEKNIPQLVIVGRLLMTDCLQNKMLNNPLVKDSIKILGCSDEELNALYKNCLFTVLPTLWEGWSLTLPESLSYGKLCLCSDVAPLKEIGENIAYFINPYHPAEWANVIADFVNHPEKIEKYEQKIKSNWKSISWAESTKNLYNYLTEVQNTKTKVEKIKEDIAYDDVVKTDDPLLYYDISLLWHSVLSGIPRTEMLLARNLYKYNKNMKFFWMNGGAYCEVSSGQLTHLLGNENLDEAIRLDKKAIKSYIKKTNLPFRKQDVVFSAGTGWDEKSFDNMLQHHENVGFKFISTIYDLTPIVLSHTHQTETVEKYPDLLEKFCKLSDYICYGGKTAQKDGESFQKEHGLSVKPSSALKWGSDIVSRKYSEQEAKYILKKCGVTGDYIMTVGTVEARKNQEILYEAYLELLRNAKSDEDLPQIIICGHKGWKTDDFIRTLSNDKRVKDKVFLLSPTDEELDVLYQNCKFTCLPSFYEGWSLTLPESLNYGKFCLTSDTPSLKETGEDIVDYANPYDPIEWAEKIKFYYNNPDELKKREDLIKQKWHNTTWAECAENLNKIINKLMEK